jgi:hypothetical protein
MRTKGIQLGVFKSEDLEHRRGSFLAVASGVSFGGGQTVYPTNYQLKPCSLAK